MQKQFNRGRLSFGVMTALAIAVLAASCGPPQESNNSLPPESPQTQETPSDVRSPEEPVVREQPAQVAQTKQEDTAQIYWLDAQAQTVKLVPSNVAVESKSATQPETVLETAFEQLLTQPQTDAQATSIPEGTRLLGVRQQADGIHVNFSEDFTKGGGTMSMTGRVAQVLYTATTLDPDGKVWIEIEGKPLEVLGGEGLVLDQPLTRQSFEQDFDL